VEPSTSVLMVSRDHANPVISGSTFKLARLHEALNSSSIVSCTADLITAASRRRTKLRRARSIGAPFRSKLPSMAFPAVADVDAKLMNIIERTNPDIVHLDLLSLAHLVELRGQLKPMRWVLSINDSYELLMRSSGAKLGLLRALLARRVEKYWLPLFDSVDVVSKRDLDFLRKRGHENVRVVPIPLTCRQAISKDRWDSIDYDLVFFATGPGMNRWVERDWRALSDFSKSHKVACVGGQPTPGTLGMDTTLFEVLGFVPSLGSILERTRIVLVPSMQASGVPTKAIEALEAGACVLGGSSLLGLGPSARSVVLSSVPEMLTAATHALHESTARDNLLAACQLIIAKLPSSEAIRELYFAHPYQ
jgi:hypothetical protein